MQGSLSVLKPFTEPRKRNMTTANAPMKMPRYLYCVNKNDVAPGNTNTIHISKMNNFLTAGTGAHTKDKAEHTKKQNLEKKRVGERVLKKYIKRKEDKA